MNRAKRIFHVKRRFRRGLIEIIIWQVPTPVPPAEHPYKYRMVYIVNGERVVGYDNERGKGDHRHPRGSEFPYPFSDPQQLIDDFMADVEEADSDE